MDTHRQAHTHHRARLKMQALQALCLLDTPVVMIDNVLLTLFRIFKQDASLLTCILHYRVGSGSISVM